MNDSDDCVWLFDVDNTLLDNDRFGTDLGAYLAETFGATERDRYWRIYATLRDETGVADYLGALQRFRTGVDDEPELLRVGAFMLDYPFAERLYTGALDVVAQCRQMRRAVVLSDGDIVFQPRKIVRAGLWNAFAGEVLICVHKEHALDAMQRRYPAVHYVMVDDKPGLLAAIKRAMGERVTTIFVRQGHYAAETAAADVDPPPDRVIDRIGDLTTYFSTQFKTASRDGAARMRNATIHEDVR
ncbi:MAG TPA: HAD family hydrolase [Casimicrobiaceae bacterium]|nr:HAD family hydrolase [Casimicrobiaceae bacterium]